MTNWIRTGFLILAPLLLVGGVSTFADEEAEKDVVQTYEGKIGGVEDHHVTLLTADGAKRFEVVELTQIDLDGTPVMLDKLLLARYATIESTQKNGVKVARKIAALSVDPDPRR